MLAYYVNFFKLITVKRLIIGKDLFGEIGEIKKLTKINLRQMNNILRTSHDPLSHVLPIL